MRKPKLHCSSSLSATVVYPTQHEISKMLEMSLNRENGMKRWWQQQLTEVQKKGLIENVIHRNLVNSDRQEDVLNINGLRTVKQERRVSLVRAGTFSLAEAETTLRGVARSLELERKKGYVGQGAPITSGHLQRMRH